MNKTLQKKLLSYSALATAFLAVEKSADGQIVYHQVDTTLNSVGSREYYFLDLNGDGIYDFEIYGSLSRVAVTTGTSGTNSYFKVNGGVYALNSNAFNISLRPQSSLAESTSVNSFVSTFAFTKSGYMPLKLIAKGNTYMGWVRLSVMNNTGVTIISYGYDLTPSKSIILGDSGCNHQTVTPVIKLQGTDTLVSTPSTKYQWYLNGAPVADDTTQLLIKPQQGLYSIITTDTGECKTQSLSVNYTKCGSNNAGLTISSCCASPSCNESQLSVGLNYYPPLDCTNLRWYGNGQIITTNDTPTYIIFPSIDTSTSFYAVVYNNFTRCYDTSNIVVDTLFPPPPKPVIIQHGDTLFATDSLNQVYIYSWYINSNFITSTDSDFYIADSAGVYTVGLINESNCTAISAPYNFTTTSINELFLNARIKVYGNDNTIYINFSNASFLNGTIEIYNIEGQKLQQQTITNTAEILNVQQYAKGIYLVTITKNDVRKVYKVALL